MTNDFERTFTEWDTFVPLVPAKPLGRIKGAPWLLLGALLLAAILWFGARTQ